MIEELDFNIAPLLGILRNAEVLYRPYSLHNQLSIQCSDLSEDTRIRLSASCGSFKRQNVSRRDEEFKFLNPEFSILLPYIKIIESKLDKSIRRLRLMKLLPKTCLSYHKDECEKRVHMVINTNPNAMFVCEGVVYTMPTAGNVYTLRTNVRHTAINASYDTPRIHLVGSLI